MQDDGGRADTARNRKRRKGLWEASPFFPVRTREGFRPFLVVVVV